MDTSFPVPADYASLPLSVPNLVVIAVAACPRAARRRAWLARRRGSAHRKAGAR